MSRPSLLLASVMSRHSRAARRACCGAMPAMGSQAAAVLAIPAVIELLEKLDCVLLTSDDAEQFFRRLEGPRHRPCDALGGDDASPGTRDPETAPSRVATAAA